MEMSETIILENGGKKKTESGINISMFFTREAAQKSKQLSSQMCFLSMPPACLYIKENQQMISKQCLPSQIDRMRILSF